MTQTLQADATTGREMIASTGGIVVLDFTAAWCPPCRLLEPVLDQLVTENDDLTIVTVDVEASPELAAEYQVMGMPTLVFLVDGEPVRRIVGARGISALREELHQVRVAPAPE